MRIETPMGKKQALAETWKDSVKNRILVLHAALVWSGMMMAYTRGTSRSNPAQVSTRAAGLATYPPDPIDTEPRGLCPSLLH